MQILLQNVPATAAQLQLGSVLNAQPFTNEVLPAKSTRWDVKLPADSRGQLNVHLNALDAAGCAVAAGMTTVQIQGGDGSGELFARPLAGSGCELDRGLLKPLCSRDGWCWSNPLPQGNSLNAIWASSPEDVWIAGQNGLFLHWQGRAWESFGIPGAKSSPQTIHGLWGTGPGDLWAVGEFGLILHWTGGPQWQPAAVQYGPFAPHLHAIWGRAAGDVFAVGSFGAVAHWDGVRWESAEQLFTDRSLYALHGSHTPSGSILYATGENGAIYSLAGGAAWKNRASWVQADNRVVESLYALGQTPDGTLWGAGDSGTLLAAQPAGRFIQVPLMSRASLRGLSGHWLVGTDATVLRSAVDRWQAWPVPASGPLALSAVWEMIDGTAMAVGESGAVRRFDGTGWRQLGAGERAPLAAIWRDWAAGGDVILRRGETGWQVEHRISIPGTPSVEIRGLWGAGALPQWAISASGDVLRSQGGAWTSFYHAAADEFLTLAGASADRIWVGGGSGSIYEIHANTQIKTYPIRTMVPPDPHDPNGITVNKRVRGIWQGSEVWAVGESQSPQRDQRSLLCKITGDSCRMDDSIPTTANLYAIWGADSQDLWAVGQDGLLLHRVGSVWKQEKSATSNDLLAIWGTSGRDIWAVGVEGTILHYDGSGWSAQQSGTRNRLTSIWADPVSQEALAAGDGGAILVLKKK